MFGFFEPRSSRERRKVWEALSSYPIYSPPFKGGRLRPSQARANFEYFIDTRDTRSRNLMDFLRVIAISDENKVESISDIGGWLFKFGGFLLPQESNGPEISALATYKPGWTEGLRGLNVINDLGTYIGDYITQKTRKPDGIFSTDLQISVLKSQ